MRSSITIVGASLSGIRAAETLRSEGFKGRIKILGDEERTPYDRPPLSKNFLDKISYINFYEQISYDLWSRARIIKFGGIPLIVDFLRTLCDL